MAKKLLMVLMALSLATAAFASGQSERGAFQGDKVTLKGTVSFLGFHPILKSGDKQYMLMVPPYLVEQAGVKDGAQVTVQGYQLSNSPRYGWAGNTAGFTGFFVTQATVGGKDYDLSRYYGPGNGPRYGAGGYGPGFCNGYGPGYGAGYGGYGMMGRGYGPGYGRWGYGMMGQWDGDDQ
jgi:hypothetical protein